MKRMEEVGHARFLTFSCYQRLPLFNNDSIKQLVLDKVQEVRMKQSFRLWAYVVMPEHVHMLILPDLPHTSASSVLGSIKRSVGKTVLNRWKKLVAPVLLRIINPQGQLQFWQRGGGYDHNVIQIERVVQKVHYIHENPVRRGLVERAVDWRWSSALWYEEGKGVIEIDPIG